MAVLNVSFHPGIAEELRKSGKLRHRAVCKVVYHSDLVRCHRSLKGLAEEILRRAGSYYQGDADSLAAAAANLSSVKQEPQQPDAQLDLPDAGGDIIQESDAQIYQKLVYKHAQDHLKETLQAGGWYSSASVGEQITSHDTRLRLQTRLTGREGQDAELVANADLVELVAKTDLDFAELSIPEPVPFLRCKHLFLTSSHRWAHALRKDNMCLCCQACRDTTLATLCSRCTMLWVKQVMQYKSLCNLQSLWRMQVKDILVTTQQVASGIYPQILHMRC